MKLGAVVSAVNLNPHYMSFVPQFLRAWTTLFPTLEIIVVVIADEMPSEFLPFSKYLRLFPVSSDISSTLAAQCIRLLWPRFLDTKDAVLITDIDMIPTQRDYYIQNIKNVSDDTIVVYRHGLPHELYMCYVAGTPATWRGLFGEEPAEDILARWHSEENVWSKDQIELTKAFHAWSGPKKLYTDRETNWRRLCRSFMNRPPGTPERDLIENRERVRYFIRTGYIVDYHALSNETHREFNEFVVDCLVGFPDRSAFVPENGLTSYLPLLFQSIAVGKGPVIECGMGNFSTPVLASLGRKVVHYETNLDWFERFDVPTKYLVHPDNWVSLMNLHKSTDSVIFIDQAPGEIREKCIEELTTGFNGIIVAHDTEPRADYGYKMRQHFHKFRYVVEVKTEDAWATALSNSVDITQWIGLEFGRYTISAYDDVSPRVIPVSAFSPPVVRRHVYPFLFRK
jgi:hypothetical protein